MSDFGCRISGVSVNVARADGWLKVPEIRHPKSDIRVIGYRAKRGRSPKIEMVNAIIFMSIQGSSRMIPTRNATRRGAGAEGRILNRSHDLKEADDDARDQADPEQWRSARRWR